MHTSRRHSFIAITGKTVFPQKFCGSRWLENSAATERAALLLPDLKKFVNEVKTSHKKSYSFLLVETALKDVYLESKLEFFKSIVVELEPFLTKYQSPKPLAPFLYDDLMSVLKNLLMRYVKEHILKEATTAKKMLDIAGIKDATHTNFKGIKDIDIGKGAKRKLPKESLTTLPGVQFYTECRSFLVLMGAKLAERCPLKYRLTRAMSSIVPAGMVESPGISKKRFDAVADLLLDCNRISTTEADRANQQYSKLLDVKSSELKNFDPKIHRLDSFYSELIGSSTEHAVLWKCLQMLLVISHGNASVEGGFSVNKSILVENMKERTVVAQRIVYDAVKQYGSVTSVPMTKEFFNSVRSSHMRYKHHLEEARTSEQQSAKELGNEKSRHLAEIKEREQRKRRLEEELENEKKDIVLLKSKVCRL